MKNYFLLILMMIAVVSCTNEELTEDVTQDNLLSENPLQGMTVDLLGLETKNGPGSSEDNPIPIDDNAFLLFTDYTFGFCQFPGEATYPYIGGGEFLSDITSGTNSARFRYNVTPQGCFIRSTGDLGTEFLNTVFYRIRGEVVRSFPRGFDLVNSRTLLEAGWYRNVPNSDQIQRVNFFQDGSKTFGEAIDFPLPTDIDCTGISELPTGNIFITDFPRGTRAVRDVTNGPDFVFESNGIRLFFIGLCSGDSGTNENPVPDICAGIEEFQLGQRYRAGDQVTFQGYLFTRLRRGWRREGKCN